MFCELVQDYGIDFVSRVRDEKLEITARSSGNGRIRSGAGPPSKSNGSSPAARSSSRCGLRLCSPRLRAFRITLISDEAPHRQIAVNAERAYRVVVAVQSHLDGTPILDKKGKDTLACVPHLAYRLHHQPGARALCGTHAEPEGSLTGLRRAFRVPWSQDSRLLPGALGH